MLQLIFTYVQQTSRCSWADIDADMHSAVYLDATPENNWSISRRASYFTQILTQFVEKTLKDAAPHLSIVRGVSTEQLHAQATNVPTEVAVVIPRGGTQAYHRLPPEDLALEGAAEGRRRGRDRVCRHRRC